MSDSIMNMPWMPWILLNMLEFFIIVSWKGSEFASSSEYASVTQGSIENGPPYSSGSQYARA